MPKVIFIQPSQYESDGITLVRQKHMYLPGLALPVLAALVPDHWEVKTITEIIEDVDFNEKCDLVGLSAMGYSVFRAIDIAREFKKRGKIVFLGGLMASYLPDHMRNVFNGIVMGPAEKSLPELLNDFECTGEIQKIYDHPLTTLSGLPVPRYDYLPKKKIRFMLPVQSSRGCPNSCFFCSTAGLYKGNYLVRPVDEVIRDINKVKQLGYRRFFLLDDNMGGSAGHIEELAGKLIPLRMKWAGQCTINFASDDRLLRLVAKSGCRMLSVGVESLTQEGLDLLNKSWLRIENTPHLLKKISKAGIIVSSSIIIGTDSDTEESIRQTARFVIKNKISIPIFNILTPLPGTALFMEMKQQNRLLHEDISKYTGFQCVHNPKNLTAEKTNEMFWWIYNEVYSVKNILKRNLFTRGSIIRPWMCLFSLYINFHYRKYVKRGIGPLII